MRCFGVKLDKFVVIIGLKRYGSTCDFFFERNDRYRYRGS